MGAGASKAPPDITAKSLEAKRVAQEIFRFMTSQMKFEEYLTLANPDQCKKYVILIADSLQKFFMKVKIVPDKTKDGYIYFRRFDDVKGATPMSQQYCTVIALFFVRIFQIYGALALSILDTDTNVYEFAHGGGLDELEAGETVQVGGTLPTVPEEPLRSGEALPGIYNVLTPFLSRIRGDNTFYKFTGQYILMMMNPTIFDGQQQYGMQFMYERGASFGTSAKFGQILCYMRMEKTDKGIKILLSGITVKEGKKKDIKLEDSTIRITRRDAIFGIGEYGNIPDALKERFLEILRQASKEREEDDEEDDEKEKKRFGYTGKPDERREDTKIKEQFRTFALLDRLKKIDSQPIKAHCIARALQLVSSKGLQKEFPQMIVSSICDAKFYSSKDKRFPQSLPATGEKITEARGIFTLWQLFFDKVLPDMSPDMSESTRNKYKVASAYLAKAFQNPSAPASMKEISASTASKVCAGKDGKQLQVQSKEAIQALRAVVGKMIEIQALHTANVMKVLGKLFLIQPGKSITLHPNVLEGGLPMVNAIGEEARSILVAYYANCEGLYGSGVQIIERSKAKILERYY